MGAAGRRWIRMGGRRKRPTSGAARAVDCPCAEAGFGPDLALGSAATQPVALLQKRQRAAKKPHGSRGHKVHAQSAASARARAVAVERAPAGTAGVAAW